MSCLRHGPSALAVCLVAVAAVLAPVPRAAAQPAQPPFGEGTHAFRRILHDLQLEPLSGIDQLDDPRHTLLIVLGETDVLDRLPGGLGGFLNAGGAALIATDRAVPDYRLREFGVMVEGDQVRVEEKLRPMAPHYREFLECPLLESMPDTAPALLGSEPLRGGTGLTLGAVATNRPSYLLVGSAPLPHGLSVLATLPRNCLVTRPDNRWWLSLLRLPFAVGGEVGAGRLLVLADHSLFINDMLLQDDNDNIPFTYNCLDWLTASQEVRNRVLFVDEGEVRTAFDIPLKEVSLPLPPLDALVPLADDAIQQMEADDVFNKTLLDFLPFERVWVGLVVLLSAVLVVYGFYRLTRARHRFETSAPLLDTLLARTPPARSLMEERHQALLGRGNLWEPARALARQWFESAGVAPWEVPPTPPHVRVAGGWWRRRAPGRLVRRLWYLAYATRPVPVSRGEFARLPGEVEQLQAALASGVLTLGPASQRSAVSGQRRKMIADR